MFLDKIVKSTKNRLENKKDMVSFKEIKAQAENLESNTGFPFEKALIKDEIAFVCEVKKASPSKGIIAEDFPYLEIAKEYEAAGAAAISVLTEPEYFLGRDKYLMEISQAVSIPTLRKDFIIDSYQIYEAKILGASAFLLICEILNEETLREYIKTGESLGLSALVESHTLPETEKALKAGAKIIGVNNRNLKTFEVDLNTTVNIRKHVPDDVIFVSESGISTARDMEVLKENKVNAVLIGETLMRSRDKRRQLDILRGIV